MEYFIQQFDDVSGDVEMVLPVAIMSPIARKDANKTMQAARIGSETYI